LGVITEGILDSSPKLFFESFDSSSTWEFLNVVWKLPRTMLEDLNLPLHGVLLDPLIEDSYGPLINCDSCSTFDETWTFLVLQPYSEESVRMRLTLPAWELRSPLGLPKLQSLIARVKTPCIVAFSKSLESYWNIDVENGLAWAIWTFAAQIMAKRKVGCQITSLTPDH
jgi:hypothetical protein